MSTPKEPAWSLRPYLCTSQSEVLLYPPLPPITDGNNEIGGLSFVMNLLFSHLGPFLQNSYRILGPVGINIG